MRATAEESAELKMALKRDPETPALALAAELDSQEADEALREVEDGHDVAAPGSWVANRLLGAAE